MVGGSTYSEYEAAIDKNWVVVCIVDSDKMAPKSKSSGTAKNVLRYHKKRNIDKNSKMEPYIGEGCATLGREVENYIPLNLLAMIRRYKGHESLAVLGKIMKQETAKHSCNKFWHYFDLKGGLNGEGLVEKARKGSVSEYTLSWICDRVGHDAASLCNLQIKGFNEKVIVAFLESSEAKDGFGDFLFKSGHWNTLIRDKFLRLFWYFVAAERRRT